jgi:hypothetical protein
MNKFSYHTEYRTNHDRAIQILKAICDVFPTMFTASPWLSKNECMVGVAPVWICAWAEEKRQCTQRLGWTRYGNLLRATKFHLGYHLLLWIYSWLYLVHCPRYDASPPKILVTNARPNSYTQTRAHTGRQWHAPKCISYLLGRRCLHQPTEERNDLALSVCVSRIHMICWQLFSERWRASRYRDLKLDIRLRHSRHRNSLLLAKQILHINYCGRTGKTKNLDP